VVCLSEIELVGCDRGHRWTIFSGATLMRGMHDDELLIKNGANDTAPERAPGE
jgi:hypothetical protein